MKYKFIHLVVLALTVVSSIATAIPASAVTYGDPVEAPQMEFPEVVPVWVGGTSLCTGTLITQQVVLTAAHCVYGQAGPFQISVGGSTLNSGRLIDIDATWYHPRYDAKYKQNDIGLLHLKTPANVSRLGKLPSKSLKSVGKKFLIVGWGADQNGSITGKLNRLTLNNQTAASKKIFKGIYNPKTMIGAGRYFPNEILYGGGCTGDSGGPLYMGAKGAGRTVIGLTAFGASGCTVYKPTIFTRVDFYTAAIKSGIQLLNSRAATAPITSGKATPSGVGPTTTPILACSRGGACRLGDVGPGGGVVFYDAGSRQTWGRYIETALSFASEGVAFCDPTPSSPANSLLVGASGTEIGGGDRNSSLLEAACRQGAAAIARQFRGGGLTDWRLPNRGEIIEMHRARALWVPGAGSKGDYEIWSSTERDASTVYVCTFKYDFGCSGGYNNKYLGTPVRPIRTFG